MKGRFITARMIAEFREHLILEERSEITVEKYIRDVKAFSAYTQNAAITKETVIAFNACKYKQSICIFRLARFKGEILKTATASILPRRKGTDKSGIRTALQDCGT